MDPIVRREIIMKHYQEPINKGLIEDDRYILNHESHESCVDHIDIMVRIENDIIEDIRFDGEACAIVISSTSILIETLLKKTTEEARVILTNYKKMINEEEYDQEIIKDLIVYNDINKQPNRKLCALLSTNAMIKILKK